MRKVIGSVLTACLIMSTSAAFGAIKEGSFAVTPVIGGYVFDGAKELDTTFLLGIRAGYNFTKNFGVEALYDYATEADGKHGLKNISMQRYGGELLYHF
ncbi:MAG: outer membrane beta-barrel protein, partial [Desulfuromonadaceae bacterium]|nr:outer membrane beta-barrel protein [Desulfuromonadaceae bacterium]